MGVRWHKDGEDFFIESKGMTVAEIPNGFLRWMVKKYVDEGEEFCDEDLIVAVEQELEYRDRHGITIHD